MIDKNTVQNLVEQWLQDTDYFLVDLQVSRDDRITVEIDHADGVWIDDCVRLSQYIEEHLSRDEEDYELEVGSAGVGQPFKVYRQWENHVGKDVEVLTAEGKKLRGVLKSVDETGFVLTQTVKRRLEGEKRPKMVEEDLSFGFGEVKECKYLIKF